MSGHWENLYTQYYSSDNDLCVPVLKQEQLAAILMRTHQLAESFVGICPKPEVSLDLEHLQVADYALFPPITLQQQEKIRQLQASHPIRTDEMAYLALRSLIGISWGEPHSENCIRCAAAYEIALELALTEASPLVGETISQQGSPLPYWGRLGFVRVMATIPEEQLEALQLQRVTCTLLKEATFNARSIQYESHGVIGLNFALEPILKSLNRMLLHFFHTREMAGPRRLERAWASLAPITAYFWAPGFASLSRLSLGHVFFDRSMMYQAHTMTANQVDFIIRHELGHLVLEHGPKLQNLAGNSEARMALQHEFEFSADAFAQGSIRSTLYSRLRIDLQRTKEPSIDGNPNCDGLHALHDHQSEVTGVRLLFTYMDAIDRMGQKLKSRLGDAIRFNSRMDTHPSPSERLARLNAFHIGEHAPTSQLIRFAEGLFADIFSYLDTLDDEQLARPLRSNS